MADASYAAIMLTKKPFKQRSFSENVCATQPVSRRRALKLNVSIDEGTEELLQLLAEFGDTPLPLSVLVNDILMSDVTSFERRAEIQRAYKKWEKDRP